LDEALFNPPLIPAEHNAITILEIIPGMQNYLRADIKPFQHLRFGGITVPDLHW
jgi:hypothetical protein